MGQYRDVLGEIEVLLDDWTKSPDYEFTELPCIVGFLLEENDQLTSKIMLLRDLIDGDPSSLLNPRAVSDEV